MLRVSRKTFGRRGMQNVTRLTREPFLDVPQEGRILLNNPALNKGSAFTMDERRKFKLTGLLPGGYNTLEIQVHRAYSQFCSLKTDLQKNQFCESLKVQNEVLFFALITSHLKEMMRIIYTPTQGDAIAHYSHLFRRPTGCFLDIHRPDDIDTSLAHFGDGEDIDYIVVTDAEGILGIGDQGIGGIGISISKLVLMTVCGGVHPNRVIPVVLDCGTDNENLLNDPLYMGNRHGRIRGKQYNDFVDHFVSTVQKRYPDAVLHFEDFGRDTAHRHLEKYKDQMAVLNDDIQGTGAVTMSALKGALHSTHRLLRDARILIYGAGSAGMGIANQIVDNLETNGVDRADSRKNIYLMDRPGLLTKSVEDELMDHQKPFMKDAEEFDGVNTNSLFEVVRHVKPCVLIGCSTQPGAFTKEIVQEMAKHVERPVIFPLSNPTRLHEATPGDLIDWTDGRVLVATGSPFTPVNGRRISENNNCFIFPGIGLGAVLSRSSIISKAMIAAAVDRLAALSPILRDPNGPLLPDISDINDISCRIATSVVLTAKQEGLAQIEKNTSITTGTAVKIPSNWDDCYEWVKSQMWIPEYRRYRRMRTWVQGH